MKKKILADFQICISIPLIKVNWAAVCSSVHIKNTLI